MNTSIQKRTNKKAILKQASDCKNHLKIFVQNKSICKIKILAVGNIHFIVA